MPNNLVSTVLLNYISQYEGRLDKQEQRPSIYGALDLFKAQTNDPMSILDMQTKAGIDSRFNTSVIVPVINFQDLTVANVRSCNIATGGATSAEVTLTAITYVIGILEYPQQYFENYISYQASINKKIEAMLQKFALTMDTACVNKLDAVKNTYFPSGITAFYPVVGNALQVPQAEKNDFYNQFGSIFQTMDFPGNIDVNTQHGGLAAVRRLAAQGQGNAVNEGFQLLGYTWYPSNRVTNGGAGIESTLYGVAPGNVAIYSRVDPDARAGTRIHESDYWDIFPNAPYLGMDLGVHYQAQCADASAIQASGMANSTATKLESWQFSLDVFYLSAYNSAAGTRYDPIVKAEILS
jgi:hypothetical protein